MSFIENYRANVSDQSFDSLSGFGYEKTILTSLHSNRRMDDLLIVPNTKLFLLIGPEGYGKHSLANAMSNYLYDYDYEYFYVDCEELADEGNELASMHGIFSDIFQYTAASIDEEGRRFRNSRFYVVLDGFDKICRNKNVCKLLRKSFDCLESDYSEYDCECIIAAITEKPEEIPAKIRQYMNVLRLNLPNEEDRKVFFEQEFTFYLSEEDTAEDGFVPYDSETGARAMAELTEGLSYAELRKVVLQAKLYYRQQVARARMDFELYKENVKAERIGFLTDDDVRAIVHRVKSGRVEEKVSAQGMSMPQVIYVGAPNGMPVSNGMMAVQAPYLQYANSAEDPDVVDLNMYNRIKEEQQLEYESEEEYNLFR